MTSQFESPKDTFSFKPLNRDEVSKKAARALPMDATTEDRVNAGKRAREEYDQETREQTLGPVRATHIRIPIPAPPAPVAVPVAVLDLTGDDPVPAAPAPVDTPDTETESFHDDPAASGSEND